ncbi:MAG TPA: hypothetical protein VGQ15_10750, partial [Gaiellaceae bacterium]|nr:hypothetical protein [Gaiellaceae bacterium]
LRELAHALGVQDERPGLLLAAAEHGARADGRLLLVVDQFEEVFTACPDRQERARFLDELLAAVTAEQRATVVLGIRADYYGRCAEHPGLAEQLGASQVLVGPMDAEEVRRAIELPAHRAGLRVEPQLSKAMVADVAGQPGGLPLLSTALLECWERRQGRTLTLAGYRERGGVHGAVARLAERAYLALDPGQQAAARRLLLRLAGPGEGQAVTRRRVALAELEPARDQPTARALEVLTARRLLTVSDATVEVAHEALLREWPRLRAWLEEDAEGRKLHRHLIESAKEWQRTGRDPGELYRGARLAAALDFATDHPSELNELEREFVDASREASERESTRMRRTNRRLRLLLAGAGSFLAVALGAGIVAGVKWQDSQHESARAAKAARAALAREVASAANVESANDLNLSLLLAIEAVETTWLEDGIVTQEASDALLSALGRRAFGATLPVYRYPSRGISAFPDGIPFVRTSAKRRLSLDITGLLQTARGLASRSLTAAECRQYLHASACPDRN